MTNENILKQAVDKAIKNGYKKANNYERWDWEEVLKESLFDIIFNHNFAQHFFGLEWEDGDEIATPMSEILAQENMMPWQHHLRRMVLCEEPLLYLKEFL